MLKVNNCYGANKSKGCTMKKDVAPVFKVTALLFMLIVLAHSYHLSRTSSDGTNWIGVPSKLYITTPFSINKDVSGSPMDSLKKADFLLSINGEQVETVDQIVEILKGYGIDDDISLSVYRATTDTKFQVRITRSLLPNTFVREIPKAVFIKDIYKNGPAQKAGLLKGDVIIRINHIDLENVQITRLSHQFWSRIISFMGFDGEATFAAQILLLKHRPGDLVVFDVLRDNDLISAQVRIQPMSKLLIFRTVGLLSLILIGLIYILLKVGSRSRYKTLFSKIVAMLSIVFFLILYSELLSVEEISGLWMLLYLGYVIPFVALFLSYTEIPAITKRVIAHLDALANKLGAIGRIIFREPRMLLALLLTFFSWYLTRSAYYLAFPQNEIDDFFSIAGVGHKIFESSEGSIIPQIILATLFFGIIYLGLVCISEFIFNKRLYENYFLPEIVEQLLRSPDRTAALHLKNQLIEEKENEALSRLTWVQWSQEALPVLGFLGTVVGIGLAMQGMMAGIDELVRKGESIDILTMFMKVLTIEDLHKGFKGLGFAFDTTFLGLAGWLILGLLHRNVSKRLAKRLSHADERLNRYILIWGTTSEVSELIDARIFREEIRSIAEEIIWEDDKFKSIRNVLFQPVIAFSEIDAPGCEVCIETLDSFFGDKAWRFDTLSLANNPDCCGVVSITERNNTSQGLGIIQFQAFNKQKPQLINSPLTWHQLFPKQDLSQCLAITTDYELYRLDFKESTVTALEFPSSISKDLYENEKQSTAADVVAIAGTEVVLFASNRKLYAYPLGSDGSFSILYELTMEEYWNKYFFDSSNGSFWAVLNQSDGNLKRVVEYKIQFRKGRYTIEPTFDKELPEYFDVRRLVPLGQARVLMLDNEGFLHYLDLKFQKPQRIESADEWTIEGDSHLWLGRDNWIAAEIPSKERLQMWKLRRNRLYSYDSGPGLPIKRQLAFDKFRTTIDGQYLIGYTSDKFLFWEFPKHRIDSF